MKVDIGQKFFGSGTIGGLQEISGIGSLASLFIKGSFALAGLIILFFFIMAGVGMIAGAGGSDPQKMEQSKKTATSALIGFVVVFTSYWIVKLIGNIIGMPDLI